MSDELNSRNIRVLADELKAQRVLISELRESLSAVISALGNSERRAMQMQQQMARVISHQAGSGATK